MTNITYLLHKSIISIKIFNKNKEAINLNTKKLHIKLNFHKEVENHSFYVKVKESFI